MEAQRAGFPPHSSSSPFYFFINPTLTITIMPLAITHNISADQPTWRKMTGIKYDTRSLCHHCREGHFPLEWNGGRWRADIFFSFLTNRPNAALESSNFHSLPPALLLENHNKPLRLRIQTHGKMSTFMRLITFVPCSSSFLSDAVSHHSKLHLKCTSPSVRRGLLNCLVLSLHELPFWPSCTHCWLCFFGVKASLCQQDVFAAISSKPFRAVISAVMTCSYEEQCFTWEVV